MPRALYDAFGVTVERIKRQKTNVSKQAMDILTWVFLARMPLSIEQLLHALAVEPGDKALDRENFVDAKSLLDCCLGLVIVDDSSSTVRLVHKTLQDHLEIQNKENGLFDRGHHEIAHVCLTYMAFDSHDQELTVPNGADIFSNGYALLEYATCN